MAKISKDKKVLLVILLAITATIYVINDVILQVQAGYLPRFTSFLILVQAVLIIHVLLHVKKKP